MHIVAKSVHAFNPGDHICPSCGAAATIRGRKIIDDTVWKVFNYTTESAWVWLPQREDRYGRVRHMLTYAEGDQTTWYRRGKKLHNHIMGLGGPFTSIMEFYACGLEALREMRIRGVFNDKAWD